MPDEIPDGGPPLPEADPGMGIDPRLMVSGKEVVYTPNVIGVTPKDPNGVRKLNIPVTPAESVSIVLGPEHQKHLVEQLSGGVQIADLADLGALTNE